MAGRNLPHLEIYASDGKDAGMRLREFITLLGGAFAERDVILPRSGLIPA